MVTPQPAGAEIDVTPYDAVVLLSFGGPDGPDDVIPFLQNVTAGKGIPADRLAAVGEHYFLFGGASPINAQNRALQTALRTEMDRRGVGIPLFWGNRNWAPYTLDAFREAAAGGAERVLVITTSAYSSYSGCRQYREDIALALEALAGEGTRLRVDQVRRYFNTPGFVESNTGAVLRAWAEVTAGDAPDSSGFPHGNAGRQAGGDQAQLEEQDGAAAGLPRLVFVTHSIPLSMASSAGPGGDRYTAQHHSTAEAVAARVSARLGVRVDYDLAYCSRSGPPSQPWLEPDINDHLQSLAQRGVRRAVVSPIGFISDHMEVAYDLDVEAKATAHDVGIRMSRAGTAGTDAAFVSSLVDLVVERARAVRADDERVGADGTGATGDGERTGDVLPAGSVLPEGSVPRPTVGSMPASHDICGRGCCPNPRQRKPAACGVPDEVAPAG